VAELLVDTAGEQHAGEQVIVLFLLVAKADPDLDILGIADVKADVCRPVIGGIGFRQQAAVVELLVEAGDLLLSPAPAGCRRPAP